MQTSVPDLWVDQGGGKLYPIILRITGAPNDNFWKLPVRKTI